MSEQLDLFGGSMPLHARRGDPHTSHAAAASVRQLTIRAVHRAQLTLLAEHGDTHDGLWSRYQTERAARDWPRCSVSGFRTRVSELVDLELVADSGTRVRLPSHRLAIVWQLTRAGHITADAYAAAASSSHTT